MSISNEIKRLIFAGALKPGDRLPPETELADRLGVSRHSVREALRVLEITGFLKVRRGATGGRIIVDTIATSIGNSLGDALQLNKITIDQLTFVRIELEKVIVKCAVENADDTDILYLKKNVESAEQKVSRGKQAVDENIQFHKLLATAAKNPALSLLLEALLLINADWMSRACPGPSVSRQTVLAHKDILEALIRRDAQVARERMEAHLRETQTMLRDGTLRENSESR